MKGLFPLLGIASAGVVALLAASVLLVLTLPKRERSPAEYLPAGSVALFSHERPCTGDPLFSLFSPPRPLPPPIPESLQRLVTGERMQVLLAQGGTLQWMSFHRLEEGVAVRRQAQQAVATLAGKGLVLGAYVVVGEEPLEHVLLTPRSMGLLSQDQEYLSLLHSFSPLSCGTAVLRSLPDAPLLGILHPILAQVASGAQLAGLTTESLAGTWQLTLTVPSPLPPLGGNLFSLLSFSERGTLPPLLLAAEGRDIREDLHALIDVLSEGDRGIALVLLGVLESAFARTVVSEHSLDAILTQFGGSYAFLLAGGSGASLQWFLALQPSGEEGQQEFLRELEHGFSVLHSPAVVRSRVLPNGRTVRDVIEDPLALQREEESHRKYTVMTLRHARSGSELAFASRKRSLLLSSSRALLLRGIDAFTGIAQGEAPRTVTHRVHVQRGALRLLADILPASPFLASLHDFLRKEESLLWYRQGDQGFLRHVFVIPSTLR